MKMDGILEISGRLNCHVIDSIDLLKEKANSNFGSKYQDMFILYVRRVSPLKSQTCIRDS